MNHSNKINWYYQLIMFLVMVIIGLTLNPMNILAYNIKDLYFSYTLFYGALLMASNMIWSHELVNFFVYGYSHFNNKLFIIGIILSLTIGIFLLRNQFIIDDKQWLKRMISHHSTALTTSQNILNKSQNPNIKELASSIIKTQKEEIKLMKSML